MILSGRVNSLETPYYDPLETNTNRRVRRSAAVPASFSGTFTKKLRVYGDLPRFLKCSPDSSSISVGPHDDSDPQACFKMHMFLLLTATPERGNVVIIETQDGRYLARHSPSSSSSSSNNSNNNSQTVALVTGTSPQQTTALDDRFFRIYQYPGDQYAHVQHIQSGMHLSADQDGVSLHAGSDSHLPNSTLFKEFNCTHT